MLDVSPLGQELIPQLLDALGNVGLEVSDVVSPPANLPDRGLDATAVVNGRPVGVEVKAVVTERDAASLVALGEATGPALVVVARRIARGARRQFQDAGIGYFDARGHLRLALPPGILIDADVATPERSAPVAPPFEGDVAKEVAIVLLTEPTRRPGPRAIGRITSRAPSAVAGALSRLRANDLLTSENEPVIPDLFWALSGAWRRRALAMAKLPVPGDRRTADLLQLGLGRDEGEGWALTDALGARAWDMPVVLSSDYPPDFYVPTIIAFQRAQHFLGVAEDIEDRACTVAIAPVPLVCRWRSDLPSESWKVANHVVVALDLATDPSRGREILERWDPPEEITRVW